MPRTVATRNDAPQDDEPPKKKPTWRELPTGDPDTPDFRALVPAGTAGSLTADLVEARRVQALKLYVQGKTPEQIALLLHIGRKTVERDITYVLDAVTRTFAQASPQHVFVRYALFQLGVIQRLQTTYEKLLDTDPAKTGTAVIAALRAQSDIMDKVYDKGDELGVITKRRAAESIRYTPADLRLELRREVRTLSSLLDRVDAFDQFKKLRKPYTRSAHLAARIRRVQTDPYGFVFRVRDWKYRATVTREQLVATLTTVPQNVIEQEEEAQLLASLASRTPPRPTPASDNNPIAPPPEQAPQLPQLPPHKETTWLVPPKR